MNQNNINISVSVGELIDKFSILEIKKERINDNLEKLKEIENEYEHLSVSKQYISTDYITKFFYKILKWINNRIYDMTNEMKKLKMEDESFPKISFEIFEYNQKRFRIKNLFNNIFNSKIKEQKSYSSYDAILIIENEDIFYEKIPEINYLMTVYDKILLKPNFKKLIYKKYSNVCKYDETNVNMNDYSIVNINDIVISNDMNEIFSFEPIKYLGSGHLGDMIHTLSVINENYLQNGRKGILYVSDKINVFHYPLIKTFNDTFEIINSQKYISKYCIYDETPIDIDLGSWRSSNLLYKNNWYTIFKSIYNVEWGKRKWLNLPNIEKWNDKLIITCSNQRLPSGKIDVILNKYKNEDIYYVTQDIENYNLFIKKYDIKNLKCYITESLYEMICIINSCKLLFSNLSSPLAFAFGLHKESIVFLHRNLTDNIHINNLPYINKLLTINE
jgi:hypothetical protein